MDREIDPGFIDRAVASMAEYALRSLTHVLGIMGPEMGSFLGTGIFCEIGGRKVVVTTSQTLDAAFGTRFFRGVVFSRGEELPPGVAQGQAYSFDGVDLGFYVASADLPLSSGKAYWPHNRIEREAVAVYRDYLVVTGFSSAAFTEFGDGYEVLESATHGSVARYRIDDIPETERDRFQEMHPDYPFMQNELLTPEEFAIHFGSEAASSVEDLAHEKEVLGIGEKSAGSLDASTAGTRRIGPAGLIGSPVFRLGLSESASAWTPECSRLVGIVTRWLPEHKALVATSSATLLEAFGEAMRSADG